MKHVICCGLAVLDHVFYLPEIPKTPIKSFATNYHSVGGGNAATAAVALSRAGGQAVFWGRLGDDQNGDLILSELEAFGVDVGDVLRLPGVKSGVSSVLIDDAGERLITNYSDPKLISDANWLPLERLKESNAVLVDFTTGLAVTENGRFRIIAAFIFYCLAMTFSFNHNVSILIYLLVLFFYF